MVMMPVHTLMLRYWLQAKKLNPLFALTKYSLVLSNICCNLDFQSHEDLWKEIAEKITLTVQQIIEFAKMIPGFMTFLQDDQIMLLKAGT
jgi:hypothetical protein